MPCYHPMERWQLIPTETNCTLINKTTGELVPPYWIEHIIDQPKSNGVPREKCIVKYIPCGQCIGCRLQYSKEMAIRQTAEAKEHEHNYFLTLTQDDEHLPWTDQGFPTLEKDRISRFMKTLRRDIQRKTGQTGIRFYGCGEYGGKYGRPHYHINIFGADLEKAGYHLEQGRASEGGILYRCERLEEIWGRGICKVGTVTEESAAYVARYILKKQKGQQGAEYYALTGQVPEYTDMSRRPGIGYKYYTTNKEAIYQDDKVYVGKFQGQQPPKAWDRLYDFENHDHLTEVKMMRQIKALEAEKVRQSKSTLTKTESLEILERQQTKRAQLLIRSIEL